MSVNKPGSDMFVLEEMIDKLGVTYVVSAIATICSEKAAHIRENWQDKDTARLWDLDGKALDRAARNVMSDDAKPEARARAQRPTAGEWDVLLDAANAYEAEPANFESDDDSKRLDALQSAIKKMRAVL